MLLNLEIKSSQKYGHLKFAEKNLYEIKFIYSSLKCMDVLTVDWMITQENSYSISHLLGTVTT